MAHAECEFSLTRSIADDERARKREKEREREREREKENGEGARVSVLSGMG